MSLTRCLLISGAAVLGYSCGSTFADPCGMVPPIYSGPGVPIARTGDQNTYVFYKDKVETFVIHPAFQGKVEEFGMLIPFPKVPELRKVSDNIFPHIRAAIDPPEVAVYVGRFPPPGARFRGGAPTQQSQNRSLKLEDEQVRVVKEEAVGMYEVAVLEAGSANALKRWMDDHGYKYPEGMDNACEDYVRTGWCFVAVKTRVSAKKAIDPNPGQRDIKPELPAGASFDGHVQAMGFRFKSDRLVVPMRLSAFNAGELHNIVYVLSDEPMKIRSIPEEYVVRQVPGETLLKNVTEPLPLRVIGGTANDIQPGQKKNLKQRRNPVPHNGAARDLFAADLLAVSSGQLSHRHEEEEKMLLQIGEALNLRGPAIDKLNEAVLAEQREKIVEQSLKDIRGMTLSVIDGNFPREVLANQNLTFLKYEMPTQRNTPRYYDAKSKKPATRRQGILVEGALSLNRSTSDSGKLAAHNAAERRWLEPGIAAVLCLTVCGLVLMRRRRDSAG